MLNKNCVEVNQSPNISPIWKLVLIYDSDRLKMKYSTGSIRSHSMHKNRYIYKELHGRS